MTTQKQTGKKVKNVAGPISKGGQTGNSNGVRQRHNLATGSKKK